MDARDFPPPSARVSPRLAHLAVFALAALLASALWRGYGRWLFDLDVH
jgi:hypothetical protein